MKKSYLKIFYIVILLASCQEVFIPKTDYMKPVLVIEGYLSTHTGKQQVLLSYSSSLGKESSYRKVTGATVYVTDDMGNRFDYHEKGDTGTYQTDLSDMVKGLVGHTYVLHIETKDGDIYESAPQTIKECAEPFDLYCTPAIEKVTRENVHGNAKDVYKAGIDINVSSIGVLPGGNYYQYTLDAYEEHILTVIDSLKSSIKTSYYQYSNFGLNYSAAILTANADGISDHTFRNKKVLFVTSSDMYDNLPPQEYRFPNGYWIYMKFTGWTRYTLIRPGDENFPSLYIDDNFRGMLCRLQQRSLTPDAYEFWNDAENQLKASGKLFDPVTARIKGNIKCVSDSTKKVYGVFTAYDEKSKFAYFYISLGNVANTKAIDSLPPLPVFDTVKPPGWIDP